MSDVYFNVSVIIYNSLNLLNLPQAIERIAGLSQVRVAHHRLHGPGTGSNS